jgi:threonine-phosphate decarboxylase
MEGFSLVPDFPKRVVHGGSGKRELERTRKNILDFSASVNPYPPKFSWHCDPAILTLYPDDQYCALKERIGQVFHRDPAEICVGNGSIELIRVFCLVALGKNKNFFTESPTFGEYALSAQLSGSTRTPGMQDADVVFQCNPNNPTGLLQTKADLCTGLEKISAHDGILFCDEAFIELSDPNQSLVTVSDPHLFVLRSLTKCFSVPGIRFGYGFGDPELIEKIEITRPPWSVNSFAEAFALEAFRHMDELAASRRAIEQEREWLSSDLNTLGLRCYPSSVNYILVECNQNAAGLCELLSRDGILVRDCTSFGMPTAIRIAVRTREENRVLIEALSRCVQ